MGKPELVAQLRAAFPAELIDGGAAFAQWGHTYLDAREYRRAIDGQTGEQVASPYIVQRHDALGAALSVAQRSAVGATLELIAERDPDGSPGRAARAALNDEAGKSGHEKQITARENALDTCKSSRP
jgi:hypothetical protein